VDSLGYTFAYQRYQGWRDFRWFRGDLRWYQV